MENAVFLFFEKEAKQARQDGMQSSIYKVICDNLRMKYGKDAVSKQLQQKLDDINYYPALEEIQAAILFAPSLDAFKRKTAKIVNKYKVEIQELRR